MTPTLVRRLGECADCCRSLFQVAEVFGTWCRGCGLRAFGVGDFARAFGDPRLRAALVSARLRDFDDAGARNPVTGRRGLDGVAERCALVALGRLDDGRHVDFAERCLRELLEPPRPAPEPEEQKPDPRPGAFYVSARRPGSYTLLAGPWPTHAEALRQVDPVWAFARRVDPVGEMRPAFGTCRVEVAKPPTSTLGADPSAWS